ncbi:hypothetical protein SNOG_08325 [Parastagonospora nodorum SN15]|uniref:Uncharacterized protein n=1 Tax=Phaeosphaeria nodorum (strain SN15 / ATCC MYA-4574 / FGSC 10173) TaxID=321614 RepID=Q0UIT9_PHANO|nr:hypothetical protein SNOG_08325 [Parastagonospora nodorum SN15]EAT84601.1 hypothetical protein SNOG_08325 [Parastagonospora nodorum SN15]
MAPSIGSDRHLEMQEARGRSMRVRDSRTR